MKKSKLHIIVEGLAWIVYIIMMCGYMDVILYLEVNDIIVEDMSITGETSKLAYTSYVLTLVLMALLAIGAVVMIVGIINSVIKDLKRK